MEKATSSLRTPEGGVEKTGQVVCVWGVRGLVEFQWDSFFSKGLSFQGAAEGRKLTCGTRLDRDAIARRGRGRLLRVFPSVGRKKGR